MVKDKAQTESNINKNQNNIGNLKADKESQQKTLDFVRAKTGTVEQMNSIKKKSANKKMQ